MNFANWSHPDGRARASLAGPSAFEGRPHLEVGVAITEDDFWLCEDASPDFRCCRLSLAIDASKTRIAWLPVPIPSAKISPPAVPARTEPVSNVISKAPTVHGKA